MAVYLEYYDSMPKAKDSLRNSFVLLHLSTYALADCYFSFNWLKDHLADLEHANLKSSKHFHSQLRSTVRYSRRNLNFCLRHFSVFMDDSSIPKALGQPDYPS